MAQPYSAIPGPKGLPIVGLTFRFLRDPWAYVAFVRGHGDIVKVHVANRDIVYLYHPDLISTVLLRDARHYTKGSSFPRARLVFGDGLVVSEGEKWRRQRARMAPAFTPKAVRTYNADMEAVVHEAVAAWPIGERSVGEALMALTLKVAVRQLFSADTAPGDAAAVADAFAEISRFVSSPAEYLLPLPLWLPLPAHRRFQAAHAALEAVVTRIIAERRQRGVLGDDLLGRMLQGTDEDGGGAMTDADLRDEVRTLLLAGHETTAIALCATLHLLATHPAAQEAVAAELRALGRPPQADDALPRTQAALAEGLRLHPPVPILIREPSIPVELGGYDIPAGTLLGLTAAGVHRDPRWFPDPDAFRPERWLDPAADRPRGAYFPFGLGPRACIGERLALVEGQLILGSLLQRFVVEPVAGSTLQVFPAITLRLTAPLILRFRPRDPAA